MRIYYLSTFFLFKSCENNIYFLINSTEHCFYVIRLQCIITIKKNNPISIGSVKPDIASRTYSSVFFMDSNKTFIA